MNSRFKYRFLLLLCLLAAVPAMAQEDCRMTAEQMQPIIDRYNPS
jgi:hypothetical protein